MQVSVLDGVQAGGNSSQRSRAIPPRARPMARGRRNAPRDFGKIRSDRLQRREERMREWPGSGSGRESDPSPRNRSRRPGAAPLGLAPGRRSETAARASPGESARHFWDEVKSTSSPVASNSRRSPPREETASTRSTRPETARIGARDLFHREDHAGRGFVVHEGDGVVPVRPAPARTRSGGTARPHYSRARRLALAWATSEPPVGERADSRQQSTCAERSCDAPS